MTFRGEHRIAGTAGEPNRVRVTDGDMTWDDVTEEQYNQACFQPPLADLPWRESAVPSAQA